MSILSNVRDAMENENGLQDMIGAAIDVLDEDENFTDLEPNSDDDDVDDGLPGVEEGYFDLPDDDEDQDIDDGVGEDTTADVNDFLQDTAEASESVDCCDDDDYESDDEDDGDMPDAFSDFDEFADL